MKLDKIAFAMVVNFIGKLESPMDGHDINRLDELIDIEIPGSAEPQPIYPANHQIERLMALMAEGTQKIEAIKTHRAITGMGLKESKDAVERYWPDGSIKKFSIADLRAKLNGSVWNATEYSMIENFLQSLLAR